MLSKQDFDLYNTNKTVPCKKFVVLIFMNTYLIAVFSCKTRQNDKNISQILEFDYAHDKSFYFSLLNLP